MTAHLLSLDGLADIPIDRVLIVVGRHHGCDVRLVSGKVSRRHCCLALDTDGILVRDLGSTNGTRINGRRVDVGLLRQGDELCIAQSRFRMEIGAGGETVGEGPPRSSPPTELSTPPRAEAGGESPTWLAS